MAVNPRVLADKYTSIDKQKAFTDEIVRLEKELVKLNDMPRSRRPLGFDVMKKDIVDKIKVVKASLEKEAKKGRLLTRNLGLQEEEKPTAHTMKVLKTADGMLLTEPTREYLDQRGQVLPPRHANLPHQLKMLLPPRPNHHADVLSQMDEFKASQKPKGSTSTSADVSSPTSTKANTRGNLTVTGSAGSGNTSVTFSPRPSQ